MEDIAQKLLRESGSVSTAPTGGSFGRLLGKMCGVPIPTNPTRAPSLDVIDREVMQVLHKENTEYISALTRLRDDYDARVSSLEKHHDAQITEIKAMHALEMQRLREDLEHDMVTTARHSSGGGQDSDVLQGIGTERLAHYWKGKLETMKQKLNDQELQIQILQQQVLDYEHMSHLEPHRLGEFVTALRETEIREKNRAAVLEAQLALARQKSAISAPSTFHELEAHNLRLLEDLNIRTRIVEQLQSDVEHKQTTISHLATREKEWANLSKAMTAENSVLQDEVSLLRKALELRTIELEALRQCVQDQDGHLQLLNDIVKTNKPATWSTKDELAAAKKKLHDAQQKTTEQLEKAREMRAAMLKELKEMTPQRKDLETQLGKESADKESERIRLHSAQMLERTKLENGTIQLKRQLLEREKEVDALKAQAQEMKVKLDNAKKVTARNSSSSKRTK